jgi:hypothetical protein
MDLTKQAQRQARTQHRTAKHGPAVARPQEVHCACVIHGDAYDWIYVERLYRMVSRNISAQLVFHVFTEHDRSVPPHMVKHCLEPWPGVAGPKRAWWYKLQMFDPRHWSGDLLYFDLDVVIVNDITWAVQESTEQFWAVRDFRYLQRSTHWGINSSMMWWNVAKFAWVWEKFSTDMSSIIQQFPGDQDFLQSVIAVKDLRLFDTDQVVSWRWQCLDGGWDFRTRTHLIPGQGTRVPNGASVLAFHGRPKPHEVTDSVINQHWF